MVRTRFEQLKRYLKACSPKNESKDLGSGSDFWRKLECVVQHFRAASQTYVIPGSDVTIDEVLQKFKGRSKHTMQINAKQAGKGFKI